MLLTGIPKLSIKDNQAFAVLDTLGEAPRLYSTGAELGVYYNDTRYLQTWEMSFNGQRPVSLASDLRHNGSTLVLSMTNRDLPYVKGKGRIPRDTLMFRRVLSLVDDTLYEIMDIQNFDSKSHDLHVEQWIGGGFDDLFEVRGFARARRGRMLPATEIMQGNEKITVLQYEGLDKITRKTFIQRFFEVEKIRLSPNLAGYFTEVTVPPKATVSLRTIVSFDRRSDGIFHGMNYQHITVADQMRLLNTKATESPFHGLSIESDHLILNRSIENAKTDIFMLLTEESEGLYYPYAGVPWFSAPFGRDGIITAYQLLPWYPAIARGVLEYAFGCMGDKVDSFTDEEPGKIFHEMRRGEMAHTKEVPFIPYYGSVDSTPLCLILLHEYIRWTRDLHALEKWWPCAMRAMEWIEKYGDADGDGFLEYLKKSPNGLVNQGWKDSHDSIMHEDGKLAVGPIRLCEVQGYAFRARMAMSSLAKMLGHRELSVRFRRQALELKILFSEKFWDYRKKMVYLALDGKSAPCAVLSSNMGHCLWSDILETQQARSVVDHLMSDTLFSGYGVRTLASCEAAYNPMSYHNGSVWPHDNSIIMEGLRNYGHTEALERLATALLGVLEMSTDFRLPELFCGFRKRGDAPPVPYEVACKPQAWAAGSVFLMLKSLLGISMDPNQKNIVLRTPVLSPKISNIEIKGLHGNDWEMDLLFRRGKSGTTVDITRKTGDIRVLRVN